MKSGLASGALSLLIFCIAMQTQTGNPPDATQPASTPEGGAWKAFEWWYAQRAYPNAFIPHRALRSAHAERAATLRSKGKRDLPASATGQWRSLGPDNIGGRVLAIAVHPVNTGTVFVGSASGGLWKTVTGGDGPAPWTRVETGYPTLSVSAIAIDQAHPDTIYIGTGEISRYVRPLVGTLGARASYGMGVLRSTDGGTTWDTTGLSWAFQNITAVQEIVINPLNSSTVFAATSEGVYRSTDAGASWTLSNPVLMAMDMVINPSDTTILISSHGNLNSSPNPGLYMTFDGGGSWSKLEGGLPASNFGRTSLDISRSNPAVVYAGIANGSSSSIIGLYRSTDGGLTWALRSTTNYVGSQGWYDNVIAVHPTDPSTVYCGGFDLHKSSNAGTNLPVISSGSVHVDHHALAFDPADPRTVYIGTDGGMYKTTDSGTTFINLNKGFLTTQFYPGFANASDDSTVALGGLQDNGTLKYVGGPSWIPVWGGDGGWCAIDPTDKNTLYAESQYGRIVRSYNGGGSFSQATVGLPGSQSEWNFIPPFSIAPSSPNVLYAGSRNVYKTTNYGTSWFPSNGSSSLNGTNIACIGVSWTSPDTLLAGTGSGALGGTPLFQIFSSTNGGTSWSNVTGPLPDRYPTDLEFDPSDSRSAYLTYSGYGTGHLFRTTDLGVSWTDISSGLPDIPHQCVVVDPVYPEYLYAGTDLGVYRSSDSGASWAPYADGMPDAMILDLVVSRGNDALRAATFGNGVYERPLPRFSVLTLTFPVGNELFVSDQEERIRWDQQYTSMIRIEFSADAGASWSLVADSVSAGEGFYDWTVPAIGTTQGVIRISNLDGGTPADSGLAPFTIIVDPDLLAGWNMISVPVRPPSLQKDSLFPTSVSNAFEYTAGYTVRETLSTGRSYWLKFPTPQFTDLTGDPIVTDSVNLSQGWNMIGSIGAHLPVEEIVERPPGILTSQIFGYRKGYSASDTIVPGRGYWVKAGKAGSIVLSSVPFPGTTFSRGASSGEPMNSVTIADADGFSQTLHFISTGPGDTAPGFDLPPVPPGGGDARFASGRGMERMVDGDGTARTAAIVLQRLKAPVRLSWSVRERGSEYILRDGDRRVALLNGEGEAVLPLVPDRLTLAAAGVKSGRTPSTFTLEQNYPNPFNPVTTIRYLLPRAARVRLTVHDNLGREITRLADGPEPAGERTREWDGSDHASGVYFYRLTFDGGRIVRKMLLIK